ESSPGVDGRYAWAEEPKRLRTLLFRLLVSLVDRGAVAGLFNGGDQLVGSDFVVLNFDHRFVGHCDFSADHSGDIRKCGPHFSDATDGSRHPRDLQIDDGLAGSWSCWRLF